jgi:hypothetical protein
MKSPAEALRQERDRLVAEIDALTNKVSGLDLAIELITKSVDVDQKSESQSDRRGGTAEILYSLLEHAGGLGLNVQEALEMAARRGNDLNKSSVSSLLSRMKRVGTVVYVGKRYILKDLARRSGKDASDANRREFDD